jgi:hypothetical protein
MPTIENHSEHPYNLPKHTKALPGEGILQTETATLQESITFPRAGKVDEEGNPVPSRKNVTADVLKRMKENPVTRGWFKPVAGKLQLVVAEKESEDFSPEADTNALGNSKGKAKAA